MSVKSALKIKINGQWVAVPVMIGDAEIDGVVRYDGAQALTEEEKATARENIGAGTGGDVEIPNSNLINGVSEGSLRTIGSAEESDDPWYQLGQNAFAQGMNTEAPGRCSHAEGYYTIAGSNYQHVQGKYNIASYDGAYAHIVGNGYKDGFTGKEVRSNAHTLDWDGNGWFAGSVYVGGTGQHNAAAQKLITQADMEAYVNEAILGGAW